jgi:membrane associated rhomboid family serine protease
MLVYWSAIQFFGGLASIVSVQGGGVAFWAHLGVFFAGVALIKKLFARRDYAEQHRSLHWSPRRVGWRG